MGDCEQPPPCITQHPGFQAVCLNRWVLQAASGTNINNNTVNPLMVQNTNSTDILHIASLYDGAGEFLGKK